MKVISLQYESLDALLYRITGASDGIEAIIAANPSFINTPVLPLHSVVIVPDALLTDKKTSVKEGINLWS